MTENTYTEVPGDLTCHRRGGYTQQDDVSVHVSEKKDGLLSLSFYRGNWEENQFTRAEMVRLLEAALGIVRSPTPRPNGVPIP